MKIQLTSLGVLAAGVLILGPLQACAPTEPMVVPTVAEATPLLGADAAPRETPPPPADASRSAPESPAVQAAGEAAASSLVAAGTYSETPLPPATSMTDLTVKRTVGSVVVHITGDGDLTYDVTKLSRNRLVIDLMNVVNGTKWKAVRVGHPFMRQVRIGVHQFPQAKVRVVLDLGQRVPYTIVKTGRQLRVTLSEQALALEAPQETHMTSRPAPNPADKVARPSPRRSVPVPVPDRLKFLDPLTPVAQPKPDQPTDIGTMGGTERFIGKRISLDFQDADISSVLRLIADVSGLNMVVGEAVKARVTLKLLNVPWDQALDLILKLNNLGQIREGNILWIDTLANITKLRDDATRAKEATLKAEELVTRIIYLNFSDAAKTVDVAKSNLSPRGEIKIDARTNALVIRDIPDNVTRAEKVIRDLDQRTPQVQIEARIVQATKAVSAPKIITLDNKPAKIEQGSQVPFQTTSLQGTQTTFVDATLTLNVTPHVIPHANTVRLEIKATKNSIGPAVSTAGPTIDKKEATTEILLRDGETTVLGGIFEETRTDSTQGVPWFNRIPFLGRMFKNEGVSVNQTELLVFITPIIIKE